MLEILWINFELVGFRLGSPKFIFLFQPPVAPFLPPLPPYFSPSLFLSPLPLSSSLPFFSPFPSLPFYFFLCFFFFPWASWKLRFLSMVGIRGNGHPKNFTLYYITVVESIWFRLACFFEIILTSNVLYTITFKYRI